MWLFGFTFSLLEWIADWFFGADENEYLTMFMYIVKLQGNYKDTAFTMLTSIVISVVIGTIAGILMNIHKEQKYLKLNLLHNQKCFNETEIVDWKKRARMRKDAALQSSAKDLAEKESRNVLPYAPEEYVEARVRDSKAHMMYNKSLSTLWCNMSNGTPSEEFVKQLEISNEHAHLDLLGVPSEYHRRNIELTTESLHNVLMSLKLSDFRQHPTLACLMKMQIINDAAARDLVYYTE